MIDLKRRTIAKAFSWKFLGLVVLSVLTLALTGDLTTTGIVALGYHAIQLVLFFLHEKLWNRIHWGRSKGLFVQLTGLSGAGKSTVAQIVADRLRKKGIQVEIIDGDDYRTNLCRDLGFLKEDRMTNIRRLGFVGQKLANNSVVAIMAAINPVDEIRQELKGRHPRTKLVWVKAPLDEVRRRDPKGLYRRAFLPPTDPEHIPNFTGVTDPFEIPSSPDLILRTAGRQKSDTADELEKFIMENLK